ncbi:MAG: sulfotransferase [Anaerolineales bacterium]|nr:sulfotransferase [Anaerolineales bacterium]
MRYNFRLFFKLLYWSLFKAKGTHARLTPKRIKSLIFWFIIIPVHNLFTWIGFGLDEIFFPGYRMQEVKAPIFIIGNFRSGSTLLQRLLVKDEEHLTAMRTIEIYIAPSITQRVFWKAAGNVDRVLFRGALNKLVHRIEAKNLNSIPMHRVALQEVDEDEGILLHNWTSSFLMFPFPFMDLLSPYLHFDGEVSEKEKRRAMIFYKKMVQKHVYYHGGKRYIAKNPAFSSKVLALREYFPDAKFIYLVRNPVDMLASKTSFFSFIWNYFNDTLEPYPFKEMLLELTYGWYADTLESLEGLANSEYLIMKYRQLVEHLDVSTRLIYKHFEIPMTPAFENKLAVAVEEARSYVSKHKYSLIRMGYQPEPVLSKFSDIFTRFDFDPRTEELMAELSKKSREID